MIYGNFCANVQCQQRDSTQDTTLKAIEAAGRKATVYTADLASAEQVAALTPTILKDGHKINILLNCAGIQRRHPSAVFPDNDWNEVRSPAKFLPPIELTLLGPSSQPFHCIYTLPGRWCAHAHTRTISFDRPARQHYKLWQLAHLPRRN